MAIDKPERISFSNFETMLNATNFPEETPEQIEKIKKLVKDLENGVYSSELDAFIMQHKTKFSPKIISSNKEKAFQVWQKTRGTPSPPTEPNTPKDTDSDIPEDF